MLYRNDVDIVDTNCDRMGEHWRCRDKGLPSRWGKCYIVRDGNMYDEYDGTYIGRVGDVVDWKEKAEELGVALKVCRGDDVINVQLKDV
jgi:hypothetical protein